MNKTSKDILRVMPRPTWHEGMPTFYGSCLCPRPKTCYSIPTLSNMPHIPRDHGSKWHTRGLDRTAWPKSQPLPLSATYYGRKGLRCRFKTLYHCRFLQPAVGPAVFSKIKIGK